jgi:hypothetical protein
MDSLRAALKELVLPELDRIKQENGEINAKLELTNKRLDDINLHLVDQSRRIDSVREDLKLEINDTNKRLDRLYEVIVRRDEHSKIEARVAILERDINELKRRIAA